MLFETLTLILVAVLTSLISGVIGMAGGVTLLAVMTFFLPWHVVIPVHGVVQLVSNGSRGIFLRQKIKWAFVLPLILGAPIGAVVVTFLLQGLLPEAIPQIMIALLIGYVLFKPKKMPAVALNRGGFFGLGIIAGGLGLLVGATGPLLAPFFLRDDLAKEEIVASKAVSQFFIHFLKIPAFIILDFDYLAYGWLIAGMCLAAIFGTRLGVGILGRIKQTLFIRLYQVALFLAALRLVYKVFSG